MTFKDAWVERTETINKDIDNKDNIQLVIIYEGGWATMIAPGYFKDTEKAQNALGKAWDYVVEPNPSLKDKIIEIKVIDCSIMKKSINKKKVA